MYLMALVLACAQVVVPDVVMEDQFEKARDVKQHRGDVVVLIYGDRKSADANKALGEQIHIAFHPTARGLSPAQARKAPVKPIPDAPMGARSPDVLAIPVACVGRVPPLVRKLIRGQIKNGSPDVPVWLDFDDVMKRQFPFKAGVPNVVVLDTRGRYRHAAAGAPTAEGTTRLLGVIEKLRREALSEPRP
jgi:hypothetical protein